MKVVHFIYNEQEVDFIPTGDENVMINATQMANIFEKRVDHFLKSDHAQAFIEALLLVPNGDNKTDLSTPNGGNKNEISTPNGGDKFKYSRDGILKTNKRGGTWMHRILALKFAAWLDPEFEVWVFETADQIILGHYREVRQATMEKLQAEKSWKEKREKALLEHPELAEIFDAELKITEAEKKRLKAMRAATSQLRFEFAEKQKA